MIEAFSLGSFVTNDLSDSSKDCNYVAVLWAVSCAHCVSFCYSLTKTLLPISATRGKMDTGICSQILAQMSCCQMSYKVNVVINSSVKGVLQ